MMSTAIMETRFSMGDLSYVSPYLFSSLTLHLDPVR
jgi:hypothetical protein